jgi:hypothetical protein
VGRGRVRERHDNLRSGGGSEGGSGCERRSDE